LQQVDREEEKTAETFQTQQQQVQRRKDLHQSENISETVGNRKYKIVFRDDIDDMNTKKQLRSALRHLLNREQPLPTSCIVPSISMRNNVPTVAAAAAAANGVADDDVSSIGHGGISITTNPGRAALQDLLSKVQKKKGHGGISITTNPGGAALQNLLSKVQKKNGHGGISITTNPGGAALQNLLSKVQKKKGGGTTESQSNQSDDDFDDGSAGNMFLRSNMDDLDSDTESSSSDITEPSLSDGDDNLGRVDETSVATSALGKKALDDLIKAVEQPEKNEKRKARSANGRKKNTKRKAAPRKRNPTTKKQKTNASTDDASSVDQGRNALLALLKNVDQYDEV
jgi:hypothetical protein